jgi:hypothetical protein
MVGSSGKATTTMMMIDGTSEEAEKSGRTFVIKAIYPVDTGAFVIAPQDEEVFGIFDLVGKEETDSLKRLFSSVYVISEEKVVGFWWEPAILKEPQKVVILAVNVACTTLE